MAESSSETTVDPEETKVFQELSLDWWESQGMLTLQRINENITSYMIQQVIKVGAADKSYEKTLEPLRGLKILEVGCGGGFLTENLARTGCDITGIDPNENLLKVAIKHAACDPTLPKITYLPETVEEFCKNNAQQYDVVVTNFVLEHVSDPKYFINCCSKCVKPGGSLFISTLAKTYLAWFIHIFLIEYVLRLLPIGVHHLDRFISATTTADIIKLYNFKIEHTQGFLYDVLTKRAYNIPFHSHLYMIHAINVNQIEPEKNK